MDRTRPGSTCSRTTREAPDGEVWTTQRFEWSAPGVRSIADEPQLAAMPMVGIGFGRWIELFRRGEPLYGLRRELPREEQIQLSVDDTLSIACAPIIVDGGWWGFVGFDECAYERVWTMAATLVLDQPLDMTLKVLCDAVVAATGADHAEVWLVTADAAPTPTAEKEDIVDLALDEDDDLDGFLRVAYPAGARRDRAEQAFLRAAANQAATAVHNAKRLAAAQGAAALQERQRIARDLHDSVSQALYGIGLGARTARQLVDDRDEVVEPLDYVLGLAEAGLAEMRALIVELRPEALAEEGLVAALDRQVRAARGRHGLNVDSDLCSEPEVRLQVKEALYRIAQEALHNIIKHADADRVTVSLHDDEDDLQLRIIDDGRGFNATAAFPGHLGLVSMNERADQAGGVLQMSSGPGTGTRLTVTIPRQRVQPGPTGGK